MDWTLRDLVSHPLTLASGVVAALGTLFNVSAAKAILVVTWNQIGMLFTGVSLAAWTITPELAFIPDWAAQAAQVLALLLAIGYFAKLAYRTWNAYDSRL